MKRERGRRARFLVLIAVLIGSAASARAEEPASVSLKDRLTAWQKTQSWMGEGLFSGVVFYEDAFEEIFDKDYFPMVRFGTCWYPVENVSVGLYVGGMYEAGHGVGAVSGRKSAEDTELYVLPVQVNLRWRFLFTDNQLLVPSLHVGGDWWWFKELNEHEDDVEGDKTGWHAGGDLAFLLDPLDPRAAHRLKKDFGIDDTYLVIGWEAQSVGESEKGLRFSGVVYSVGVRFETAPAAQPVQ